MATFVLYLSIYKNYQLLMGFEQQQSINFTCVRHPMPKKVYLVIITQVELQLTEKRADRKNFAS